MKFYVYGHYTNDGTLFYIGKGSGDRYKNTSRNWNHDNIASEYGCNPKILFDFLSLDEAVLLEKEMIKNATLNSIILTNSNMFLDEPLLNNDVVLNIVMNTFNRDNTNQEIPLTSKQKTSIKVDKARSNYLKAIKLLTDFDTIDELLQDMINNYLISFDSEDIEKIHMFKSNLDKKIKDI